MFSSIIFDPVYLVIFITSFILIVLLRPLAIKIKLVDFPNKRKKHVGNIPLIGGICIFLTLFLACFLIDFNMFSKILMCASFLILIQGIWDDFMDLKAKTKILFQTFLTAIIIYISGVKLHSFGFVFGGLEPFELGFLSIPITLISVVGLTNAINMMDGIDGNAAIMILIAIMGILYFALNEKDFININFLLSIAVAILPFLIFNISPIPNMKIFLGDSGSLFLGFTISWLLIYSVENMKYFSPSFALWCVGLPLFDFFTVIIIRILDKRPLMTSDREHFHHFLIEAGLSKNLIQILTIILGLLFLLIGINLEINAPGLSFSLFCICFLFYATLRFYYFMKKINSINYNKDK